jgi:LmbE family N-acetylglucosaminyl deacetylase
MKRRQQPHKQQQRKLVCVNNNVVNHDDDDHDHDDDDDDDLIHIIVIAHPDDESMFFIPTLHYLQQQQQQQQQQQHQNHYTEIWLVCLTTGNYNEIGLRRQQELVNVTMNIWNINKCIIIHDEDMIFDHPCQAWNIDQVTHYFHEIVMANVYEYQTQKRKPPTSTIHMNMITFDEYGISGHINHRDTYDTIRNWLDRYCAYDSTYHNRSGPNYDRVALFTSTSRLTTNPKELLVTNTQSYNNKIKQQKIIVVNQRNHQHSHEAKNNEEIHDNNNKNNNNDKNSKVSIILPTIIVTAWTLHSIRNPILKYIPLRSWIYLVFIYILSLVTQIKACRCWATIVTTTTTTNINKQHNNSTIYPMTIQHLKNQKSTSRDIVSIYSYHPYLNWISMSSHVSQFVWYRRLFILFSCYTYENQLQSITTTKINNNNNNKPALS